MNSRHKTKLKRRTFLAFIGLLLLGSLCCNDSGSLQRKTSFAEKVDRIIRSQDDPFNGVVFVAVGDRVLCNKGYGLADREFSIPNSPDTKYMIGSITKIFTTVLTMKLAELGRIDLDRTVSSYISEFPQKNGQKITLRHLLNHTSGIPHHFIAIPEYFTKNDKYFQTPREYYVHFWENDLAHEPGERQTYSSPGYHLLSVILERATGRSYPELLQEYILGPLGLKNTAVDNNLSVLPRLAKGYKKGLAGLVRSGDEEESTRRGAGAIVSTVGDLFRFQRIFTVQRDRLLTKNTWDTLYPESDSGFTPIGQVLPIPRLRGAEKLTLVDWGGSSYGFPAKVNRLIERDAVIIILSNIQTDWAMGDEMFNSIGDCLLEELGIAQEPTPVPKAPVPGTGEAFANAELTGFYLAEDGTFIHVLEKDGTLVRLASSTQMGSLGEAAKTRRLIHSEGALYEVEGTKGLFWRFARKTDGTLTVDLERGDRTVQTLHPHPGLKGADLREYGGPYVSWELQKTYDFQAEGDRLVTTNFLRKPKTEFFPLARDVFGFEDGFLFFHRYPDGSLRDFKLEADFLDHNFGSLFLRNR
jgi:CubicO group peptidase (beta-lactamase class C family)